MTEASKPSRELPLTGPVQGGTNALGSVPQRVWAETVYGLGRQFLREAGHPMPNGRPWSTAGLARVTGMAETSVQYILTGKRRPSLDSGLKISRAMGISPWVLLDYSMRLWDAQHRGQGRITPYRQGRGRGSVKIGNAEEVVR